MTQLEIFRKTVAHEPHQNFLFHTSFVPGLAERLKKKHGIKEDEDIVKFFGMFDRQAVQPQNTKPDTPPDFSPYFKDVEKPEGSFINGLGVLEIPARFHHFTGYVSPLRNAKQFSDIEEFPFPPAEGFDGTGMKERVEEIHKEGKVAMTVIGHMYESAWQVRGYEEFLLDTVDNPDWCEYILDRFMERNLQIAVLGAKAGVDWLLTGDDIANQNALMFSKPMWRRFIKDKWAKVYAAAKEIKPDIQIWYHSDGNVTEIVPEMIEIGLTILNPVQPECVDLAALKRMYGKQLVFDGTIGTQTTMPFGSPEEVKRVVRARKKELGYDGALILSPTHVLEPEVPLENIEAFISACKEG
jgi:uroporphyrinogen decarboxylase